MQDNTARQRMADEEAPSLMRVEDGRAKVRTADCELDLPITPLPEKFVEWIEQGRRSMYDKLLGKGNPGFFTSHLPVVSTLTKGQAFPFNCSNKGVGFLPKAEYLKEFTDLFRHTLESTRGRPWQESLRERLAAVSKFYFDREKIDYRTLSTLEIFEKGTYRNLSQTPLAAVHYTGNAPDYISFQVNCAVEVIKPDDPRHEFVHLARVMFEYDSFHISQTNFPYAYILWISEVLDKTPFRVPEKGNVITLPKIGDMIWAPEAVESINRAPGMIRQFITESIEKYARERGFKEITMDLVREAREVVERPSKIEAAVDHPPQVELPAKAEEAPASAARPSARNEDGVIKEYGRIYVGLDSSGPSDAAMALSLEIGKRYGAEMIGSHVYAAKMHDNRFRAMEGGLPEEFQKEKELDRQRKIHDSLITKGLELITDSYLEAMAKECAASDLRFTAVSLEGKNWKAMAEDIHAHDYDLVVVGAHGIGRVSQSQLGTVAERLLRRVRRDMLVAKLSAEENPSDEILVCLDGSSRSWGALKRAIQLGKAFGKKITAVSAFDPYFHYAMFKSLNRTLTEKARKVFKFEEQEKLHEDIIDSGLAKIYQSYLNIAQRMAKDEGVEVETHLLDGKPFEKILQRVRKSPPWLLVMGRIGFHSDEDMDIGGNTENLCRLAPCNILVVDAKAKPPVEFQAEETVAWTNEARAKLDRVPAMAQGMAMKAIQNYCIAEGFTVVTESILNAAIRTLLPPEALKRMGIVDEEPAASGAEAHDKIALSFKCQACGHVHHGSRPQQCPICGMAGHIFKLVESAMVEDGQVLATLGNRQLLWEKPALAALEAMTDATLRGQVRNSLEKRALTQRITAITLDMVRDELGSVGAGPTPGPKPASPTAAATASASAAATPASLLWTEEAVKRLERVPDGFMRNAARNMIIEHAKGQGASEINLDVVEAGLGKAREKMHSASAAPGGMPSGANPHTNPHANPHANPHHAGAHADPHGHSHNPHANPHHPPSAPAAQDAAASHPTASDPATAGAWECHLCGMIADGERPGKCSNCGTGHFIGLSADQRAKAQPSALRVLTWESDAEARLARVPLGFMRDMTRNRVEKWARSAGLDKVSMEVMDGKYGSWAEGSTRVNLELEWSEEAKTRAERIPDFIRPMVMKELERLAKGAGRTRVEAADLEQAMSKWSGSGSFHGHG